MPVPRKLRAFYDRAAWRRARAAVRARSGGRCECRGELCGRDHGGRCTEHHGQPGLFMRGPIIMGAAHLDGTAGTDRHYDVTALRDLCQRCHLRYDEDQHQAARRANARTASDVAGQLQLPLGDTP